MKKFYIFLFLMFSFFMLEDVNAMNISTKLTDKILFTGTDPYYVRYDSSFGSSNVEKYYKNNIVYYAMDKDAFIDVFRDSLIYSQLTEQFYLKASHLGGDLVYFDEPVTLSVNGESREYKDYNILVNYPIYESSDYSYYSSIAKIDGYLVFYPVSSFDNTNSQAFTSYAEYNRNYDLCLFNYNYKENTSFLNFSSLDLIHSSFDLKDINNNVVKKADVTFSANVSTDVTRREDLDFDYIHATFDKLLKEQYSLSYSDFNIHFIYEDYSSEYRYNVVYSIYSSDFIFTDGKKGGNSAKSCGTLNNFEVFMLSFNNINDLDKDLPIYKGSVDFKISEKITVLWADNIIYLWKWNSWTKSYLADTKVVLHQGNDIYSPFSSSVEISSNSYAVFVPKKTYAFKTKIAMTTAYYHGWYYLENDKYYLVPNSSSGCITSLLEGSSGSNALGVDGAVLNGHYMVEDINVYQSYIDNKYIFILHNRDENKPLTVYYNDDEFEVLNFTPEIGSLTSNTNGVSYPNKGTDIKNNVDNEYGKVDIGAEEGNGFYNLYSEIASFPSQLVSTIMTFGNVSSSFFSSMPDFVAGAFKLLFFTVVAVTVIKIAGELK